MAIKEYALMVTSNYMKLYQSTLFKQIGFDALLLVYNIVYNSGTL